MSQLVLSSVPTFSDLADSAIAQDVVVTDTMLQTISKNAKYGMVRPERILMGYFQHNDVIPLPTSPVDGYTYIAGEASYEFQRYCTRLPASGFVSGQKGPPPIASSNSGEGNLRQVLEDIDDSTRTVFTSVTYRDVGGTDHPSNDGIMKVFAWGVRGAGSLTMAAVPAFWTDPEPDASLVGGLPLGQTLLRHLNQNAKFGIVRFERFFMGFWANGAAVSLPTSPVDGYAYTRPEVTYQALWASTGATPGGFNNGQTTFPSTSSPSIDGRLLWMAKDIDDSSGVVSIQVNYGTADPPGGGTTTNDGIVKVYAIGQRGSINQAS